MSNNNPFGGPQAGGPNPFDANPFATAGAGGYSYDVQTTYMPEHSVPAVPSAMGAPPPAASFNAASSPPPAYGTVPAVPHAAPAAAGQPQQQNQGGFKMPFMSSTAMPTATGNIGSIPPGKGPGQLQGGGEVGPASGGSPGMPAAAGGAGQRDTQPLLRERPAEDHTKYAFYNPRRYRPYFDVDTTEVLWRVGSSFIGAFRANFMQATAERPDLYGPFWITTTLIFVTAVAGNYANYIVWWKSQHDPLPSPSPDPAVSPSPAASEPQAQWFNDYAKLGQSAAIFYGYTFIGSFLLWLGLRYLRAELRLVNMFCIYGYAMTIFIPISLVCILPINLVRWLTVMGGTLISAAFLLMNLKERVMGAGAAKAVPMLLIVLALHLLIGLVLKLFFFSYEENRTTI